MAGLFDDLWSLGKPTIARVRGYALAGGFGLALSCDLVVCSDDSQFGTPEIDVGLWPYMITVPADALDAAQEGARADADRPPGRARTRPSGSASSTASCRSTELDAAVDELAAALAAKSPAIMKLGRDSFYAVWDLAAGEALACSTRC